MSPERSVARREWVAITAITMVAAILRFWSFGALSLSHFDEGIYAFSGLWIVAKRGMLGLDPDVIPYAPPVFQVLVGLAYLVVGVRDVAAIAVATICGVAAIPAVGLIARRCFGAGAGASAAMLGALSLPHIAFSRKALTDAPFLLAWLVAMLLGMRFVERPGAGRAVLLGLAVGLAQNTKYNGWLAAVIVALSLMGGLLPGAETTRPRALLAATGWLIFAVLTAVLTYAPWYGFVAANLDGGYAGLLRHHRGYMGGVSTWRAHLGTQLTEASALAGPYPWRACTWVFAALAAVFVQGVEPAVGRVRCLAIAIGGAAVFALAPEVAWWLALGASPWLLCANTPSRRVVGAWWALMTFVTPFYHPYARLWLPLHAVGWVVLSGVLRTVGQVSESPLAARGPAPRLAAGATAFSVALAVMSALTPPRPFSLREFLEPDPSASLRAFSFRLAEVQRRENGANFEVWARRPLAFYLAVRQTIQFQGAPDLETLMQRARPGVWAVIDEAVEPQEERSGGAAAATQEHWSVAWSFANEADPVTVLDFDPAAPYRARARRSFEIRVLAPRDTLNPGPP